MNVQTIPLCFLLAAITIGTSGCETIESVLPELGHASIGPTLLGDIAPGETTEEELLRKLPEPEQRRTLRGGRTRLTWSHQSLTGDNPLLAAVIDDVLRETGHSSTSLVVTLNADGIVDDVRLPGMDRSVRRGGRGSLLDQAYERQRRLMGR